MEKFTKYSLEWELSSNSSASMLTAVPGVYKLGVKLYYIINRFIHNSLDRSNMK